MRGYIPPQTDEEHLIVKRVKELASIAHNTSIMRHTSFLSDRQQLLAINTLTEYSGNYTMFGGFDNAERKIIFFGEYDNATLVEQIRCVKVTPTFSKVKDTTLTHRDFLGAFLSLKIKRELIGDILPTNNGCAVFALEIAAKVIENELASVGKYEMSAQQVSFSNVVLELPSPQIFTATLASLRLDAIIAAMLKISRAAAQQLIAAKAITVNHVAVSASHYEVQENDIFTVKGYGKFKLCEIGGKSRKDRVFINYQTY